MPTPPSTVQHFTLDNGLRVYLREDHRAALVSVQLWYHVGASNEPTGQTGLSHALEHLMFEGSSKLAPGQYTTLMSRIGGDPNAFTTDDATVYPLTVPSHRVEIPLEAMADAMASARFNDATFARERDIVIGERRMNVDNQPLASARERHNSLAHGSSAYANPVIGHRADLEQLTPLAARTWKQAWYQPNNATLAVAGSIDLIRLKQLVQRHFAAIAAAPLPTAEPPRHAATLSQRTQTLTQPGLREGFLMSFNTPSQATADNPQQALALSLLPDLLGNGAGARLQRLLINDENLLQSLACAYDPLKRGDTLLSLYAFTNASQTNPQQAAQRIFVELGKLAQAGPEQAELKRARARLLARQVFARDDIGKQAGVMGQCAVAGLAPLLLDEQASALQRVTGEHVRQAATQFFSQARQTVTFMHNKDSRDD